MICSDVRYEYHVPIEVAELIMTPKKLLNTSLGQIWLLLV